MSEARCGRSLSVLAVGARVPGRGRDEAASRDAEHDRVGGLHPAAVGEAVPKKTGCNVHPKYAGSSDEMVTLMRSGGGGQYDMVSASGDASPAPDLRQGRPGGRPVEDPRLQELRQGVPVAAEQHGRRQALRHLAAVGAEHAALQHEEGEARADVVGRDLQTRSTRARSPSRTTRSRSRTRRCT